MTIAAVDEGGVLNRIARGSVAVNIAALAGLLAVWEISARLWAMPYFPPASEALGEIPALLASADDRISILVSLARMAAGAAGAFMIAVPVGLLMGRSWVCEALFNPLLTLFYPMPKSALMPLIMLWIGIGNASKILVIALGVSLPLIYHSFQGARAVDERLLWSARAMGMGPAARLLRIVLPAALPEILIGCRVALAMALIVMVSSEMIARQAGIGDILFNAVDMALYPSVYGTIVVIAAIGFAVDVIFERLRRRLVGWAVPRRDAPSPGA